MGYVNLQAWLYQPKAILSLVVFRIAFGGLMCWEMLRYIQRVEYYYVLPEFFFSYQGLEWIKPLSEEGMIWFFCIMSLLAFLICIGLLYRISSFLFFIGYLYFFLIDKTNYQNHYYLICLISFWMNFIPAHKYFSFDSYVSLSEQNNLIPSFWIYLIRFQMAIVYFYAGISKINFDWLQGEPVRILMNGRANTSSFPFLKEEISIYFISYSGLFIDLFIVPFLIFKKTRTIAFLVIVSFHLANAFLFHLGVFPWLAIALTTLFFDANWPIKFFTSKTQTISEKTNYQYVKKKTSSLLLVFILLYVTIQLILPLRHFLYPGDSNWTEEGHLFSWHMLRRSKVCLAEFYAIDTVNNVYYQVEPSLFLTDRQTKKMSGRPDMIWQFSQFYIDRLEQKGLSNLKSQAKILASLNGRPFQFLVDPDVDLSSVTYTIGPSNWIIPLTKSLNIKDSIYVKHWIDHDHNLQ